MNLERIKEYNRILERVKELKQTTVFKELKILEENRLTIQRELLKEMNDKGLENTTLKSKKSEYTLKMITRKKKVFNKDRLFKEQPELFKELSDIVVSKVNRLSTYDKKVLGKYQTIENRPYYINFTKTKIKKENNKEEK